jgi:hypothetical protein
MQHFLITYTFTGGVEADWHEKIHQFIDHLQMDPVLAGKVSYHCLKAKSGATYYHLAMVRDESVTKLLGSREFFQQYTKATEKVAGGEVTVTPLELIAETEPLAFR